MIIDAFDPDSEPVLSLKDFFGEPKKVADIALIIFSCEIHDYILNHFACQKVGLLRCVNGCKDIFCFDYQGTKIGFFLASIGATNTGNELEEANYQLGASKIIMFGSAGSLDASKTDNRYVLPTEAYRDEGMSYHYAPASDYIRIKTADKLASIFEELKLPYIKGRVWTTDAFYRETRNLVKKRREDGCLAVEMELAGVQAICDYRDWELYDFLVTGDVLSDDRYVHSQLHDANHNINKLFVALEVAKRI